MINRPPQLPKSDASVAMVQAVSNDARSDWRRALRERVVELGIRAFWGKAAFPVTLAADIPLISSGMRLAWLKALGAVGVQRFVATSGLGFKFVCHIGDLAEFPYYHRRAFRNELAICAGWLREEDEPVVFDIGANVGFFCTHLAQMLANQAVEIYAFEPVNKTFVKLVQSVERLGLNDRIHTIAAAVLHNSQPVSLHYSQRNSLCAQITSPDAGARAGDCLAHAAGTTLDAFYESAGVLPTLVKIDVEGYETAVLRGAHRMLSRVDRPALAFEYYPDAFQKCGGEPALFRELLSGYALHYIDDFEGQRMSFGCPIDRLEDIQWGCNLFAVPLIEGSAARWASALDAARRRTRAQA